MDPTPPPDPPEQFEIVEAVQYGRVGELLTITITRSNAAAVVLASISAAWHESAGPSEAEPVPAWRARKLAVLRGVLDGHPPRRAHKYESEQSIIDNLTEGMTPAQVDGWLATVKAGLLERIDALPEPRRSEVLARVQKQDAEMARIRGGSKL